MAGQRRSPRTIRAGAFTMREKIAEISPGLPDSQQTSFAFFGFKFLFWKVFRAISTGRLSTSPYVHLLPINVVVSHDPQGKIHLEDGFALRCFQRLS